MFSEKDDIIIRERFDDLLNACASICKKPQDRDFIISAFEFANKAHWGVRRKSGEPYIVHPIAVAKIVVSEIGLGVKSVVSALLHDVVEDTDYTVEDIERKFGKKIAMMVDGLTKMKKAGDLANNSSEQAENFKKMLLTLSDDVRVIIIKLADRLHNMRTLQSMPQHKQVKIVSETIYLFAPLAHRLGLYKIKTELEDLSLKYSFPNDYAQIAAKLSETAASRDQFIEKFNRPIIEKLKQNDIEFEITGRVKSIYSIWKKMQRKQVTIDEIYDLFAIRIVFKPTAVVPEKSQCWHIYSLITDIYKPKPDRIRDWVNIPKANGYEALHCTVMGPDGIWAEVQIRSQRMDEIAEKGFAAHWKYKDRGADQEGELDKWIKEVRDALNGPTEDAVEFLDEFKLNLYTSEIVVFTPKGDTRTLPKGAIVLDFAYEIHTNLGNRAIGAKVNYKMESLYKELTSGDQIEIITSNTAKPKVEWLDYVVTAKAKQAIKSSIKREMDNNIQRGIAMFDEALKKHRVPPSARVFRKILPVYKCANKEEFYSKVGAGIIQLDNLGKVLRENATTKLIKYWNLQFSNTIKFLGNLYHSPSSTSNEQSYKIAECCNPIPGDEVVGFKEDDGTIVVHRKDCDIAIKQAAQQGDRIVQTKWSSEKIISYLCTIELRGTDRMGILLDVSQVITSQLNVNIRKLYIESHDGIFEGYISLYVKNRQDLLNLMNKVSSVKGVESVNRVDNAIVNERTAG